jgi:hypothetical protein
MNCAKHNLWSGLFLCRTSTTYQTETPSSGRCLSGRGIAISSLVSTRGGTAYPNCSDTQRDTNAHCSWLFHHRSTMFPILHHQVFILLKMLELPRSNSIRIRATEIFFRFLELGLLFSISPAWVVWMLQRNDKCHFYFN